MYSGTTAIMVQGLIVLTLASMWNLLAGYAGLVSVGQQAFFGLGAYFVLIPAMHGLSPFLALPIATVGAGVAAFPLWWLVSRLRLGYFAIATWVLAEAVALFIEQIQSIGGGTGMPLPGLSGMDPTLLAAYTYWAALVVAVLAIAAVYFLLRSRVGLVLTAIRDDETAARTSGVRVGLARLLVFVVAAAGCGAAGGVLAIDQLQVVPGTSGGVFTVQWTAIMAFAIIIGGLGTIEGPILGTIVYMVLEQTLQSYNAWYLIVLGRWPSVSRCSRGAGCGAWWSTGSTSGCSPSGTTCGHPGKARAATAARAARAAGQGRRRASPASEVARQHLGRNGPVLCRFCPDSEVTFAP